MGMLETCKNDINILGVDLNWVYCLIFLVAAVRCSVP